MCVVQAEPVEVVVLSTNGKDRNSGDPQTDEDRNEKLNRELIELLHELRVAIPGVQVLFAFLLAFAGGAVLASLADTLMPEAFEHGRPLNSMATAAGFLVSFVLSG